jgi:hypothetical protein
MKKITSRMVEHWIGSDHTNKEELITLLTEIINGEYSAEEFKADVLDLWGDEE